MDDKEQQLLELLVSKFEGETAISSMIETHHPYFRAVVAWGQTNPEDIIPWLLNHINDNWHWCIALDEIIGEAKAPHIPNEYAGQADEITHLWLEWGKTHGYLRVESKS